MGIWEAKPAADLLSDAAGIAREIQTLSGLSICREGGNGALTAEQKR